jgi:hypothetical protein
MDVSRQFLKLMTSCALVLCTHTAQAQSTSDIQQLKQMMAVMKAEIAALKSASFAVGAVQQSFLSEAEFQKQMGRGWVLCDGRTVSGSRWERLGYGSIIPNCTGRFLRTSGGDAADLRSAQDDSTAINGLSLSASTSLQSNMTVEVSGQTNEPNWTGNLFGAINDGVNSSPDAYTGIEAWAKRRVGLDGAYWGRMFGHVHAFSGKGQATGGSWSTTINATGDRETRPINITVNTFVKID